MARITIQTVKDNLGVTNTYDIVNAIRNDASSQFQSYVPLANAENVAQVGAGLMINQTIQNEFIASLVDRIGLVIIRAVALKNDLAKFKKGQMPLGRTIEEIFVDITAEKRYDPEEAEEQVFRREIPNVKTLFHEMNRQGFYKQSIQQESLKTAFVSWGNFEDFTSRVISAMYNSAEVDEYNYMKLLADNYYAKGHFKVVPVDPVVGETTAKEFIKKIRTTATLMGLGQGSREYNSLAVQTRTDISDMHLIISAKLNAEVDVDVLAKAFNMSKTDFVGQVTIIDEFASPGLEAILVDRDWFMVYDKELKMQSIYNPQGLYWNYFYHVWQVLSVSRFANAVAFVSGAVKKVTEVIVNPSIVQLKAGRSTKMTAFVRATDGEDYPVVWSVVGSGTTTVASGTQIESNGTLTLGATQVGELLVKATVTIPTGEGSETEEVIGESLVTVIPA